MHPTTPRPHSRGTATSASASSPQAHSPAPGQPAHTPPPEGAPGHATTDTPLAGTRILLGRSRPDDPLARALTRAGASVTTVGLTRTVPGDRRALDDAAHDLASDRYDWLVLTSARTLEHLDTSALRHPAAGAPGRAHTHDAAPNGTQAAEPPGTQAAEPPGTHASGHGTPPSHARQLRTACVGPATAAALQRATGREADVVAGTDARALLDALTTPTADGRPAPVRPGARILLPQSAIARPTLAEGLAAAGAHVTRVDAYTTVSASPDTIPATVRDSWRAGAFTAAVLTASSAARALIDLLGPPPPGTALIALGRPTAATLADLVPGTTRILTAPTPDGEGICQACSDVGSDPPGGPGT